VSMTPAGLLRLERVDVVFDEGFTFVNPLAVPKQIEGQVAWALSDAMWQEITIKDGRTVQGNFDVYRIARMADYPPQVNIRFLKTDNKWIMGSATRRSHRSPPRWRRPSSRSPVSASARCRSGNMTCAGPRAG
jgi:xanthine dehydrogenase molybdopterin-binding subunit B